MRPRQSNGEGAMRLGDTKFFNMFALVAARTNPGSARDVWQVGQVVWIREHTSHKGPRYSFRIEMDILQRPGSRGWTLLAGREIWWDCEHADAFRSGGWVHLSKGSRNEVLKWFAEQEKALDL
jgi:hypothetical protein